MEREIKFRGKTIPFTEMEKDGSTYEYKGEWVYGYFHKTYKGECYIIQFSETGLTLPGVKVSLESVGQFTGATDSNGNDIYEGDILKIKHYCYMGSEKEYLEGEYISQIWYSNHQGIFVYFTHEECDGYILKSRSMIIEVIGNVYDNPDLLTLPI